MKKQVLLLCMLCALALSSILAKEGSPGKAGAPDENGFAPMVLKKGEVDPDAVAKDDDNNDQNLIQSWVSSNLISGALVFVFLFLFAYNAFLLLGAI